MPSRARYSRTVYREALWLAFFVGTVAVTIWGAVYALTRLFAGG